MKPPILRAALAALLLAATPRAAAVPPLINYQGRITVGTTNFEGTGQFKFALVDGGVNQNTTATAFASGTAGPILSIIVLSQGSGYVDSPVVSITDSTGTGATAVATVTGGVVTGIQVTNGGSGYSFQPTVTIDPPPPNIVTTTFWSNDQSSANGSEPGSPVLLPVVKGLYSVLLGDNSLGPTMRTIGAADFAHPDVRLRVWFSEDGTSFQLLSPDQRLAPAAYLADGSVTAATIEDGVINTAKIADEAIVSSKVAWGAITTDALGVPDSPGPGQVLGHDGTKIAWTTPGSGVWSLSGSSVYYDGGDVGIGISTPAAKLDVRGNLVLESGGNPALFTGTGTAELNRYLALGNSPTFQSASGLKAGGVLVSNDFTYANPGKSDLVVKGNVMIGTVTPRAPLTVQSNIVGQGIEHTDGVVRLGTRTDGLYAWLGTRSNHQLRFFVNDSSAPSMTINAANNVGIGTSNPVHRLAIAGGPTWTNNGWTGSVQLANAAAIGWGENAFGNSFGVGQSFGGFYIFHTESAPGTVGDAAIYDFFINDIGDVGIGTLNPVEKLDVNGTIRTKVLKIVGGADIAEPFPMKEDELAKGSVVVIDDEHPGRLKCSSGAYDKRVAGIISGANGVNPGIALHQEGVIEGGQNVSLSGRVYVQADASGAPINPGDLLTTSDFPGHAMKVTEHGRSQGAVLGKAMSSLKEGKGMVLVLVTLQ